MSDGRKKALTKYIGATLVGGAITILYISLRDFSLQPLVEKYRILCDAFTIPGALMVLLASLISVSNEGVLDGVSYCASQAAKMLTFRGASLERYGDFLEHRRGKRAKGYGFLYIVGLAFLAVAAVFLCLFYSIFQR